LRSCLPAENPLFPGLDHSAETMSQTRRALGASFAGLVSAPFIARPALVAPATRGVGRESGEAFF
jgi:hypothetical protein